MDQPEPALALLQRLQVFAAETDRPGDVWRYQLLEVPVQLLLGDTTAARKLLQETMIHTKPEGIIRMYVDEGRSIATLLQQLPPTPYGERILAAFNPHSFIFTPLATSFGYLQADHKTVPSLHDSLARNCV